MKSRLIPNMEQIRQFRNPLTAGELALVMYLDKYLPRDPKDSKEINYNGWLIFVQPYLNGSRPDIIIFNPYVGLVIYEVKDWNLDNYLWGTDKYGKKKLLVKDSKGQYPVKSPIDQVKYYKNKIIEQLVSQIGEKIDDNNKCYGLIKTGVYFHKALTVQASKQFGRELKGDNSIFPIFGFDFLLEQNLSTIVPDVNRTSYYWNNDWNADLLFWLKPPFHSIEQGTNIILSTKQKEIVNLYGGHHRIRGVAGSGKTMVLAYRAAKLASEGKRVLVLCFNMTLCHYIRDMIKRCPFKYNWEYITINYFHGFCSDVLNQYDRNWPDSDNYETEYFFSTIITNEVNDVIKINNFAKFDSIIIDEGQDFYYEWYSMLNNLISDNNEIFVVCDKKQNVYGRSLDWLDKRKNQDLDKFGKWEELRSTYRLPQQIAELANSFSERFNLDQEIKSEITKVHKDQLDFLGDTGVKWLNITSEKWLKEVELAYESLKISMHHPSDTVILLPDNDHGFECVRNFENRNIKTNHVFEDDDEKKWHRHKKAFWMGDSRLKISTVHSFKGWEVLNVILYINDRKTTKRDELLDSLVYTAITRSRLTLIVINANERYLDFGKSYNNTNI